MPGFSFTLSNAIGYYTIDEFEKSRKVKTCFSTRIGGESTEGYSSLNLGYKSGDYKCIVDKNFKLLCQSACFDLENMVLSDQVHGDICKIVNSSDKGKGTVYESDIQGVDALVTNCKDVALCIFTADCVPVFLFDTVKNVVALCHGGWRGIINGIVPKTIEIMRSNFGSSPHDIMAAIGPSIGPCCFKVGHDVVKKFEDTFKVSSDIIIEHGGEYKINLWNAVTMQLKIEGLKGQNIFSSELCTSCNKDKFYSYRRDGSITGRMISIIQLI